MSDANSGVLRAHSPLLAQEEPPPGTPAPRGGRTERPPAGQQSDTVVVTSHDTVIVVVSEPTNTGMSYGETACGSTILSHLAVVNSGHRGGHVGESESRA
eukprot:9499685-Pyramimonas_sp.AAC.1